MLHWEHPDVLSGFVAMVGLTFCVPSSSAGLWRNWKRIWRNVLCAAIARTQAVQKRAVLTSIECLSNLFARGAARQGCGADFGRGFAQLKRPAHTWREDSGTDISRTAKATWHLNTGAWVSQFEESARDLLIHMMECRRYTDCLHSIQ